MNLEKELEKLNSLRVEPKNSNFKANLRKRLLNEHVSIYSDQSSSTRLEEKQTKQSIFNFGSIKSWGLKFNSALNISAVFFASLAIVSVSASYAVMPDEWKNQIGNSLQNKETVRITANVSDADIYLNGNLIGQTPLSYGLHDGNYTVRIQKEGYGIYSDSLSVNDDSEKEVVAVLTEKITDSDIYAEWLEYNNENLKFSFNYPADWQIQEDFDLENSSENFSVVVSKGDDSLVLTYKPANDFEVNSEANISTYKRELTINNNVDNRYMQFDLEGNYLNGGLMVTGSSKLPDISVNYQISGAESDVIGSNILKTLDRITGSLQIEDTARVIAFDESNESTTAADVKVDLTELDENTGVVEDAGNRTEEENQNKIYKNTLYGYSIEFNDDIWTLSTSRAEYPVKRGVSFEQEDKEYTSARLSLRSDDFGELTLFTSYDDVVVPDNWSTCENSLDTRFEFGNKKVKYSGLEYDYQICNGDGSNFKAASNSNGEVKYAIFWDFDGDINEDIENKIENLINSINFDSNLVSTRLDDIKYSFDDDDLGIKFNYRYDWDVDSVREDCRLNQAESRCEVINIYNNNGNLVSKIAVNGEVVITKNEKPTKVNLSGGVVTFNEVLSKVCNDLNECQTEGLNYGVYTFRPSPDSKIVQVVYYNSPTTNADMSGFLEGIEFSKVN